MSQYEEAPYSDLLKDIKEHIEVYFGDRNMQRDKFLIEQMKLDDGWIPITVLLNSDMIPPFCKDANTTLKALETSDLIQISEDKKKIRRSPKYPLLVTPEYTM